jgi:hypothetical protein
MKNKTSKNMIFLPILFLNKNFNGILYKLIVNDFRNILKMVPVPSESLSYQKVCEISESVS